MDPFFSCRKASKARPLHGAASDSTGELEAVGATVVMLVARVEAKVVDSSISSKVSPRPPEGRGEA